MTMCYDLWHFLTVNYLCFIKYPTITTVFGEAIWNIGVNDTDQRLWNILWGVPTLHRTVKSGGIETNTHRQFSLSDLLARGRQRLPLSWHDRCWATISIQ